MKLDNFIDSGVAKSPKKYNVVHEIFGFYCLPADVADPRAYADCSRPDLEKYYVLLKDTKKVLTALHPENKLGMEIAFSAEYREKPTHGSAAHAWALLEELNDIAMTMDNKKLNEVIQVLAIHNHPLANRQITIPPGAQAKLTASHYAGEYVKQVKKFIYAQGFQQDGKHFETDEMFYTSPLFGGIEIVLDDVFSLRSLFGDAPLFNYFTFYQSDPGRELEEQSKALRSMFSEVYKELRQPRTTRGQGSVSLNRLNWWDVFPLDYDPLSL